MPRTIANRSRPAILTDERGSPTIGYLLVVAAVAVVVIGSVTFLGSTTRSNYCKSEGMFLTSDGSAVTTWKTPADGVTVPSYLNGGKGCCAVDVGGTSVCAETLAG